MFLILDWARDPKGKGLRTVGVCGLLFYLLHPGPQTTDRFHLCKGYACSGQMSSSRVGKLLDAELIAGYSIKERKGEVLEEKNIKAWAIRKGIMKDYGPGFILLFSY